MGTARSVGVGVGTCIAVAGKVDGYLATYTAGGAHDKSYGLVGCHGGGILECCVVVRCVDANVVECGDIAGGAMLGI